MNILIGHRGATSSLAPVLVTLATALRRGAATVFLWSRRSEQRRQLRLLEAWELEDLGLSQEAVIGETRKHFWQR